MQVSDCSITEGRNKLVCPPLKWAVFSWQWQTRSQHRHPSRRSNSLKAPRRLYGDHSGCWSSFARSMALIPIGWVKHQVWGGNCAFPGCCLHLALYWCDGLSHFQQSYFSISFVMKTLWLLWLSDGELSIFPFGNPKRRSSEEMFSPIMLTRKMQKNRSQAVMFMIIIVWFLDPPSFRFSLCLND